MPRTNQPATRRVAVVERAVAVLDALAGADGDLGTNEIARSTGINASSVSRLLATLTGVGLVTYVPETGRYRLGLRMLQLGNAAAARLDVRETARPHLIALVQATGETATLSVPGEREAITVDFLQGPSSVQSVARVGRPSVAHATAVGKLFLAHGGALPDGPLPGYTPRTLSDRAALDDEVHRTAERGWARAVGEREPDLNAVAAPVLGGRGELVAILGVQGPATRFDETAMAAALAVLCDSAGQLSAVAGARSALPGL